MGKRYEPHEDMCGCERCAREWEREDGPRQVFDVIDDPQLCNGCDEYPENCRCWDDNGDFDDAED